MTSITRNGAALLTILLGLAACSSPSLTNEDAYRFKFVVRSSQGEPLADAKLTAGKQELGATDKFGVLRVSQFGKEGQQVAVQLQCPKGYRAPDLLEPLHLTRIRALDETRAAEGALVELSCESEVRDVVVIVHAIDGGKLPVRVGAETAGVTDDQGNAQLLLHLDRGQSAIEVGLDTESRRDLLPRNPSRAFSFGRNDAIVVYDERLVTVKPKARTAMKSAKREAKRTMPTRLN